MNNVSNISQPGLDNTGMPPHHDDDVIDLSQSGAPLNAVNG